MRSICLRVGYASRLVFLSGWSLLVVPAPEARAALDDQATARETNTSTAAAPSTSPGDVSDPDGGPTAAGHVDEARPVDPGARALDDAARIATSTTAGVIASSREVPSTATTTVARDPVASPVLPVQTSPSTTAPARAEAHAAAAQVTPEVVDDRPAGAAVDRDVAWRSGAFAVELAAHGVRTDALEGAFGGGGVRFGVGALDLGVGTLASSPVTVALDVSVLAGAGAARTALRIPLTDATDVATAHTWVDAWFARAVVELAASFELLELSRTDAGASALGLRLGAFGGAQVLDGPRLDDAWTAASGGLVALDLVERGASSDSAPKWFLQASVAVISTPALSLSVGHRL